VSAGRVKKCQWKRWRVEDHVESIEKPKDEKDEQSDRNKRVEDR
jgi:hypothetical protein